MLKSRERVRKALNREPVDRIPNGFGGCETAGLHILAYDKLKKVVGMENLPTRLDTPMVNAIMEPEMLEKIYGDIILLDSPRMCSAGFWLDKRKSDWKEQSLWNKPFLVPKNERFVNQEDGSILWTHSMGPVFKCPKDGAFFDNEADTHSMSVNIDYSITPDDYNPPHDICDEKLRYLEEAAKWLYENTDYSINCGETIEDLQYKPGGFVNWWMRMMDEPEVVHEFLDKACEAGLSQLKLLDQAIGKYVDILSIADDMGDLRGVTTGPDLWREIYKPHYKKLFQGWRKITKMKINLHSCGAISDIIEDLIECGIHILNPVQISANGMNPEELKARFGDKVIFYGGCFDMVEITPDLSNEAVYQQVKNNIKTLSNGGGYIFAGVHNITAEVKEEHLRALLDAYEDCCKEMHL
jgi:uroporphyrinogen decarboxylase